MSVPVVTMTAGWDAGNNCPKLVVSTSGEVVAMVPFASLEAVLRPVGGETITVPLTFELMP